MVILMRILLAGLFGGLIGMEREYHGCDAGLRTHILVCVGSALFMITSIIMASSYGHVGEVDPSRIAAGVVTGIGFLGAGAIIRYGVTVRGLTTAASIWAVAAIGLAVGSGVYKAAGIATGVSLAVLILSGLEERMHLKRWARTLKVRVTYGGATGVNEIRDVIQAYTGNILKITSQRDEEGNNIEFTFDLTLSPRRGREVVAEVSSLPGVENVTLKKMQRNV